MKFKQFLLQEKESKFKIFVDMDGVLTDFDKALEMLSKKINVPVDTIRNEKDDDVFWGYVEKGGLEFWSKMPWMKDGKKLWNALNGTNAKILSAPARRLPDSSKGKKIWVGRELHDHPELLLKRAVEKQKCAGPDCILIDDREDNIRQWKAAGGIGILHKSASDTLQKLKKLGAI